MNDSDPVVDIAKKLKQLRQRIGFSAREVSQRLIFLGHEVSHTSIINYEKGATQPSKQLLEALAELYKTPLDQLTQPTKEFSGVNYRCLKKVTKTRRRQYELEALNWSNAYLYIERIIETKPISDLLSDRFSTDATPSTAANNLRVELEFTSKKRDLPIPSVSDVLEQFGIYAIGLECEDSIDGFAASFEGRKFVIINTALPPDRVRLNLAHELAHHIYNDCVHKTELDSKETEDRAFEFASHFLIPDRTIIEAFSGMSMIRLVQYKEKFGISLAAMLFRAKRLNLLNDDTYTSIWKQFSKLGWRKREPGIVKKDMPTRLESLIDISINAKRTNLQDVAKMANTTPRQVNNRLLRTLGGSFGEDPPNEKIVEYDNTKYT